MAIQPGKLFLALMLILLLYVTGRVLETSLPLRKVYPGEVSHYVLFPSSDFDSWLATREEAGKNKLYDELTLILGIDSGASKIMTAPDPFAAAITSINKYYAQRYELLKAERGAGFGGPNQDYPRRIEQLQQQWMAHVATIRGLRPRGVFSAAMDAQIDAFQQLIRSASNLDVGWQELLGTASNDLDGRNSIVASLREMFVSIPAWLITQFPGFFFPYVCIAIALWAILGGAIARMSALEACLHPADSVGSSITQGIQFSTQRWRWFIATPLLPVLLMVVLAGILALAGFIFFNWPALDILGSLTLGLGLLVGGLVTLLAVGWIACMPLMYTCLAVEAADGFDAVSRCYNYVLGHPWRWSFYHLLALFYGAICHLMLTMLIFLSVWITQLCLAAGVFRESGMGFDRIQSIFPHPRLQQLFYQVDLSMLSLTEQISAVIVGVWVHLCVALLAAFAVTFFLSSTTWIYLLLRYHADKTNFEEIAVVNTSEKPQIKPVPTADISGDAT